MSSVTFRDGKDRNENEFRGDRSIWLVDIVSFNQRRRIRFHSYDLPAASKPPQSRLRALNNPNLARRPRSLSSTNASGGYMFSIDSVTRRVFYSVTCARSELKVIRCNARNDPWRQSSKDGDSARVLPRRRGMSKIHSG